ncbi:MULTISPECIES: HAD family hydrolase [Streptomyces]|uniref:2-deoxyglucose-6-phosphate phosphatase n=2 Tax=Streptomyces TaxID=1883 RepID=A0A1D8FY03_9ACTN|nr:MULTISPECIES: HAD family phosphatase [Streptomyces]AOT58087.1 2-deoxyglucose-6-phosphate phosphatase [Streptomyces rubrolavendulae]KAF0649089.1 hydrolase [Streptomyces fradiae ATCC 10745 = DSM 40063]OSY51767.1 2-deoxyglucose-6-phosphate phosphatase [Streptomyces fradiae ATCC 10745 = DSM 40063]QEV11420.1 HAD family phosphatase [Streptomyces fradiae ATCC 10745 = DSM 40063]UQS28883.1 HAD family phosphatase [Streptomyces fradiae]
MTSTVPASLTRTADGSALQAVFLDMDGTLVDTEGFWWDVEVAVFRDLGHELDEAWRDIVVGGPMTRSAGYLIEATGARVTLPELTTLLNDRFEERIGDGVPLMPGAARLLAELAEHAVPTALVSASHRRIIDRVLHSLGADHFTLTVAGDEVPRTKPHPDPYLLAARRVGADPARCAVVEDTATGVAAAEAAGCRVVAVPSLAPIAPADGRAVVGSLEDVDLRFLRSLITGME